MKILCCYNCNKPINDGWCNTCAYAPSMQDTFLSQIYLDEAVAKGVTAVENRWKELDEKRREESQKHVGHTGAWMGGDYHLTLEDKIRIAFEAAFNC